ncbi:MAG: MFS transporter [Pseudomonadota bacterium]
MFTKTENNGRLGSVSRSTLVWPIAANIAFVMELTLVPFLLPQMQAMLGISVGDLAWAFNAYGIAVAIGVVVGGLSGDAFSVQKVFACGVALFAAGSVVVAIADGFVVVLAGRFVQGLGAGIFTPLVPVMLTRASPKMPGRALILWGSLAGYIAAFAPLIYGYIATANSWRIAFIVIAAIAAAALMGGLYPQQQEASSEASISSKMEYSDLIRASKLWIILLYVFCTYGCITFFLFRFPILLVDSGLEMRLIGLLLSVFWLTFSGLSTLLRNLVDQHHVQSIMLAAPVLIAIGSLLSAVQQGATILIGAAIFVGAGLACSNAPSTQMVLRFAPPGLVGASASLDITFARLGGISAVAVLASKPDAQAALVVCGVSLLAALCTICIGGHSANRT